jgi:hypothetical protein
MKDLLVAALGVILLVAVLALPVFVAFAPCDKLGWMPMQNTPNRCLKVEVTNP